MHGQVIVAMVGETVRSCFKWKSESGLDSSSCNRVGVSITLGKCIERVASTFVLFSMRLEYYLTARRISTIIYPFDLFRLREVVHKSATFNEEWIMVLLSFKENYERI